MRNELKINLRALLAFSHDLAAAVAAWFIAFWLRFNLEAPQPWLSGMTTTLLVVVPVQVLIFWKLGLYRGIWRYASLPDLNRILLAVGFSALSTPVALVMLQMSNVVPRSVLLLDPILLAGLMCGSRLAYRLWKEHRSYGFLRTAGEPVIVLGAGDAAVNLVKELGRNKEWRVVGLVDDDPHKQGRLLNNVAVLGTLPQIPSLAEEMGLKHAIIAMPSASHAERRRALDICTAAGLKVLTVPSFSDLVSGRLLVSQVRKVEVEDLLGREPVTLDNAGLNRFLGDKVVMVTGAGGSIGAELCRQIAKFRPALLILFEQNEFALYKIDSALRQEFDGLQIESVIGDIKNAARVDQIVRKHRPSVIFHAAAYKHVPLMEETNAWEAIQNNDLGTYIVAHAARDLAVEKFVLVSTDKAVNPTNVMGASKRMAEIICQSLQKPTGTKFTMVRFGNVLGSTGSVIPKFYEQIARGGPVTVTHSEVIRYFMSIPEAAQLVLQAGLMGAGGQMFVMDMGEPVKIIDLARDMIRLAGFSQDDIKIVYTGLRPGEKLFEELLADDERTVPTPHPKLRVAKARSLEAGWLDDLLVWLKQDRVLTDDEVRRDLRRWVPEYESAARPKLRAVASPKPDSLAKD